MSLPLPASFEFTVRPEHIQAQHRCNATKCVMAAACLAALPEGYMHEPSFGIAEMTFIIGAIDDLGYPEVLDETAPLSLDQTARSIIDEFDAEHDESLFELIGDGLTFVVDPEQMEVRVKEEHDA